MYFYEYSFILHFFQLRNTVNVNYCARMLIDVNVVCCIHPSHEYVFPFQNSNFAAGLRERKVRESCVRL